MRVLIFMTQFYQLGGAERLAVELAEELNKRGIHADILSQYTEDLPGVAEAKQDLLTRGIPAVHFLGMKVHPPVTSMPPAVARLRRLIREHQYDIVETSMVMPTTLAAWATRGTPARHVAGIHDVFTRERYRSKKHLLWRVSVQSNRGVRFYAISEYARKHWIEYSRTPPEHTSLIYNGIPNGCFVAVPEREDVRMELGLPREARIALFVGRLLKRKGIDTVFEALCPVLTDQRLWLLYVGPEFSPKGEGLYGDEDGFVDRLKGSIANSECSEHVRFLGMRQDVPRLMASADILVHPARIEGFGLVLAEAMAAGLPIVATNVDGIPEVLAGTDSLMVPPDDPEALREAVLRTLHRSPDEAAAAIEKGRRRAQAFRTQQRTEAMIRLFEDVVTGRGLSAPTACVGAEFPRNRA